MSDATSAPPEAGGPGTGGSAAPASPDQARLTLRGFWTALPPAGRWLLSTTAISTLGRGMVLPFTVIYMHEVRGIDLDVAGLLMGLIAGVAVLVTAPMGVVTDRLGARPVVVLGLLAQVLGAVVMAFATTVPAFVVAVALLGVSFGVGWPAFNAMIASLVEGRLRTQYFGVNFALVNLGIGVGGVVSGFLTDVERPGTFTTIFLVDAACVLVPVALLLGPLRTVAGRPPPAEDGPRGADYLSILRRPAVLWITALTFLSSFVGYGQMEAGFPAFARQVSEVSTRTIGLAFAANTAVIVLMQFLVLRRIDGHRRTRVFLGLVVLWAVAWLLLGSTGLVAGALAATAGVIVFHVFFGLGETMLQPTVPAIVNDLASDRDRGRYNAVSAMAFQLGAITAPVAAGLLLDRRLGGVFVGVLLVCLGLVAGLALLLERQITPEVNGVTPR
ncbi:MFS transporter [Phycicoccus flavus]|uniref:MFS transporter n=1 Tax=Phycicoccus flavus TaxID=2502783 RepID=A0A8T6R2S5_9MICO|nr:MFS transporter [Phycicoccus flavus]NHA67943.1 MFS transporter [Phycicoccus flavus]